jgi:mono/diheme cytochrome c family protein
MHRSIFVLFILGLLTGWACQKNPYKQGEIMYGTYCANCHMDDGTGLRGRIPPLAQADYLKKKPEEIACIIRYGKTGPIIVNGKTYSEAMPGVRQLTDFEITNIINYIHQAWGNDYGYVKVQEVQAALENCKK